MIDIHHRHAEREGEPLGIIDADQQGAHQPWTSGEGDGLEVLSPYACSAKRLTHHRDDVLLVSPRGELGHHSTIGVVHGLRGDDVGAQ